MTHRELVDVFTLGEAAKIVGRTEFNVWHHATRSVKSRYRAGRAILLTRQHLVTIVREHQRLRDDETLDALLNRIATARPTIQPMEALPGE